MNQNQMILKHLQTYGTITPIEALNLFGCFRLGARIWELKDSGENIITETETKNGKTYARYRYVGKENFSEVNGQRCFA